MAKMIEIEEQTLELILDQKETAENRCLELELIAGLTPNTLPRKSEDDGESYRILRPQWVSFIHLCILMGHPTHLDLSPSLNLGRSDHSRCRLPQEEVEWLNTRIMSIFGGTKLLLTVPVLPHPDLVGSQFTEHGYGDIYTPVMGLDLVIQEVNINQFPNDFRWSQSLRVAWGTMTAYECLSSTFTTFSYQGQAHLPTPTTSNNLLTHHGGMINSSLTTPSYPIGAYSLYTMQGACPF